MAAGPTTWGAQHTVVRDALYAGGSFSAAAGKDEAKKFVATMPKDAINAKCPEVRPRAACGWSRRVPLSRARSLSSLLARACLPLSNVLSLSLSSRARARARVPRARTNAAADAAAAAERTNDRPIGSESQPPPR